MDGVEGTKGNVLSIERMEWARLMIGSSRETVGVNWKSAMAARVEGEH